uniref:cytochrome b n=1 Tax=Camallanus lacustris TaxID=378086 RepID=UPI0022FD3A42|nr:cytochrome b [Camallanus lacustris]WAX01722.1 cytochrome b [Camallanus lacustris]
MLLNVFWGSLIVLPASKSLDLNWNYGSMLGMILSFQIFTGFFLSFYYSNDSILSFESVQYIMYEVNWGWLFRIVHFNGASLFFVFLYLHFFKGLFNFSFRLKGVWLSGLFIMIFVMLESFMGYVLVWAQMSYWACVVITSLVGVIPFIGRDLILWIWGSFLVSCSTLKLFFALHFLLPWFVFVVVGFHLGFLHSSGSTSTVGVYGGLEKVVFYPFYWIKDSYNLVFWLVFFVFALYFPFSMGDPEMFIVSSILNSPVHIVPEWYFLFAYAILRSVPSKVLGILLLLMSVLVFMGFLLLDNYVSSLDLLNGFFVYCFVVFSVVLSWLGQCSVEYPFSVMSFFYTVIYFFLVFVIFFLFWFSKVLYS